MFKFATALFAGLTGATAAMLVTTAADAKPLPVGYVNPHQLVYRAVNQAGYPILHNHESCTENPKFMGGVLHRGKTPIAFVVCLDNAPDLTTAFTTVRHEGIHVAQICKGGLLFPRDEDRNIARAQDEGWHILGYPESQWSTEAEARVMANEWDAYEVAAAIRHFCF